MHIQETFKALADPTRREILMHLSRQEMTIGEVTERFEITRAAVKKHLNILEEGQLISVHAQGRERINRLEAQGLSVVSDWIGYFDQFWDQRLGALKTVVEDAEKAKRNSIKGKV
ncbi:helix-turn-helix transcriptional regulator [Kiloniella sp. EL199]|uniref:ArsR/SmtB family transcription factor n=1 Tax=Kiloniella sp. EL199 TaxID=2107581 RepID=UPI000EA0994A|nr:metalloregulator ArsR/SmtB family transcription factor [Kiloniella sp. EL199]